MHLKPGSQYNTGHLLNVQNVRSGESCHYGHLLTILRNDAIIISHSHDMRKAKWQTRLIAPPMKKFFCYLSIIIALRHEKEERSDIGCERCFQTEKNAAATLPWYKKCACLILTCASSTSECQRKDSILSYASTCSSSTTSAEGLHVGGVSI